MNTGPAADRAKKARKIVDPKMWMDMYPGPPRKAEDRESENGPVERPPGGVARPCWLALRFVLKSTRVSDRKFEEKSKRLLTLKPVPLK